MYRLDFTQHVNISLEEAWEFFSNPANLAVITPSEMNFEIIDQPSAMYEGMLIRYKVSPLKGLRLDWTSAITKIEHHNYFIDEQIEGPYKFWHHEHHFKEVNGGVELNDILFYQLPLGGLGKIFHPILVKKKLDSIFNFRYKRIEELFGKGKIQHV